jgi:hypothetical protein
MDVLPISRLIVNNTSRLRSSFESAEPFPHLVFEDFLERQLLERLQAEFPRFEERNAGSETGKVGRKAVVEDMGSISPAFRELHELIQSQAFLGLVSQLTGIDDLLFDPEYYGGGTHENLSGQGLNYHVDFNYHPLRKWHRRLNLIIFLNESWQPEWGGNLQLIRNAWEDQGRPDVEITPTFGRTVLFETSERSWHGFEPITFGANQASRSRRSVALYFYTHERPSDEVTAEHGTYYVGRPLPTWCAPGLTLTDQHVASLRSQINDREEWVRYMYEREVRWSSEMGELHQDVASRQSRIDAIERSRAYRLGRLLTAPARLLRRG